MSENGVIATEQHTDDSRYGLSKEQQSNIIIALENKNRETVLSLINALHASEIGQLIYTLSHDEREILISLIKDNFNPDILVELHQDVREEIIELLGTRISADAITSLPIDDAVDIIEDLGDDELNEILTVIAPEHRQRLEEGLAYPEDSAGRLLEKNIVSVPPSWSVGDTIDYLRSKEGLPQDFYQIFITDKNLRPIGGVMLSRIMRSKRNVLMKDLMNTDLKLIRTNMDQEEVAYIFRQYALSSAPVVDDDGKMIGLISLDDIVDIIEEEAQEDILHLGGISETDVHSGINQTLKRRFPWLAINLVTAILASIVIGMFEGYIAKLASLAVLMPIVASMGGNAGTQTLTVIVRAIATKELTGPNALRIIGKEMLVGILNGLVFAIIAGGLTYIWYGNPYMSIIFGCATIVTLLLAGLAGTIIPLSLVKLGVDPAIASGVILTTVTDVSAFGMFLGLAAIVLY